MIALVAMDQAGGIGYKNRLPWPNIPEDFKWFREMTLNKNIIVGNTTFKNLPPLKKRYIKVFTGEIDNLLNPNFGDTGEYFSLMQFNNENEFLEWSKNDILCGGTETYKKLLPFCEKLYITHVVGTYLSDTFFPFSMHEILKMFPKSRFVRDFSGASIIEYYK